ncbi:MAG: Von Willebrand factor type domain protein [Myxococcales bacterium]|nr:Von Willebrand factor type domain protein [Myxococcales bacterium]
MRHPVLLCVLAACGAMDMTAASRRPMMSRQRRLAIAHPEPATGEDYKDWGKNPWIDTTHDHLSTFAADVDTASYTIARRKLQEGALPPEASVRVEEWVNYFHYAFPEPTAGTPFSVVMDAAAHPFEADRYVLRVGVATKPKPVGERKPANLVFLVDVSGSMSSPDKLELAKRALEILTTNLSDQDSVAIVTYAGNSRVVLPRTSIDHKDRILGAIRSLHTGGGTAMASGIDLAYEQASANLKAGTISRVIVCTDGDANVGPHSFQELLDIIASRAKQGVTLSAIGFGMGNYKDNLMEQLADKSNGNNYYIDSIDAAKRVFAEQLTATLEVAAKDVKLQVDFNPEQVARYRLIGYENRDVADQDFRNDSVAAGQMGWGHQVTALYDIELTPVGHMLRAPIGHVSIRHKLPESEAATEEAFAMAGPPAASINEASPDLRFAFAVAALADVLRGGHDARGWSLDDIRALAASAATDKDRTELLALIDQAHKLRGTASTIAR